MDSDELARQILAVLKEMDDPALSDTGRQTLAGFAENLLKRLHQQQQSDWFYAELKKQLSHLQKKN